MQMICFYQYKSDFNFEYYTLMHLFGLDPIKVIVCTLEANQGASFTNQDVNLGIGMRVSQMVAQQIQGLKKESLADKRELQSKIDQLDKKIDLILLEIQKK